MISSIFVLNKEGIVLIEKQYKERIPRKEIEPACNAIQTKAGNVPAIIEHGDYTLLLHPLSDIWILGVCHGDEFVPFGVALVQHCANLLQTILGNVSEFSIREKYSQIYQILDLGIDYGYPYMDEPNNITTIFNRPLPDPKVPGSGRIQFDLDCPWREMNVKHFSNQVLVDNTEIIDLVVSGTGRIDFCHIRGEVSIECSCSGKPNCRLVLNNHSHYEDACFHRCCNIESPDQKIIPFIPPEGKFTLFKYRLTATQITAPLWIFPKFNWTKGSVSFEVVLKPQPANINEKRNFDNIIVQFELPTGVNAPMLTVDVGRAVYDQRDQMVSWSVPFYAKNDNIALKGSASTSNDFDLAGRHPVVTCQFSSIGTPSVSGFKIEKMDVDGIDRLFKGIKYITKSGNYEFRSGFS